MAQTATRTVRQRDYLGHHAGTVRAATWAESMESMERELVRLQAQGASAERVGWQKHCIEVHLGRRPQEEKAGR